MHPPVSQLPAELIRHKVLNTAQSAEFCNISIPHWRRLYHTGKAPSPLQLSTRKLGWRASDLIDWLASRVREDR
jgi:predicted DNA-binding transcriptional regulator AlpA